MSRLPEKMPSTAEKITLIWSFILTLGWLWKKSCSRRERFYKINFSITRFASPAKPFTRLSWIEYCCHTNLYHFGTILHLNKAFIRPNSRLVITENRRNLAFFVLRKSWKLLKWEIVSNLFMSAKNRVIFALKRHFSKMYLVTKLKRRKKPVARIRF